MLKLTPITKAIGWLWKDDRTGQHSDTTLGRWLLLLPFLILVCAGVGALLNALLSPPGAREGELLFARTWIEASMLLLNWIGGGAFIGLALYEAKRWRDRGSETQGSSPPSSLDYGSIVERRDVPQELVDNVLGKQAPYYGPPRIGPVNDLDYDDDDEVGR